MLMSMRPFVGYAPLRREINRLFEEFAGALDDNARPYPALNLWEDGNSYFAEAEVPGLKLEDLEITVVGHELTIKGRWQTATECAYHRRERQTGEFVRSVTLPAEVDADKVEASLKDGVLTITLPKAESARARKIAVRAV